MADTQASHRIARAYLAAVTDGDLPDSLLTPDMTAWITTGGTVGKAAYQHMIHVLKAMCATPLAFTVQALTAEEDRVVIEATSEATLVDGEPYRQTYIFVIRIRDGLICSIAEHYNALIAQQKLVPLMPQAAARLAAGA